MSRKTMFLAILAIVATVEFLVMMVLAYLGLRTGWVENLVDAAVLVAVSAPLLHRLLLRSEGAVQESQTRLRDFLDNANDLIQSVTAEGSFLYVNRAWRETLGYSPEEIPRLRLFDIIHPDCREECATLFKRVLNGEALKDFEAVFITKDGRKLTLSGSANRSLQDDKPFATRAIFRDVTESKRTAIVLEETNGKLKRWVAELERHSAETDLLNEMAELLSTALTLKEAYGIISQFCARLFPTASGVACILNSSRNFIEAVAAWGPPVAGERVFALEQCWALRRGRIHRVKDSQPELLCHHVDPGASVSYLCIPMMAQGEALGVFHLQSRPDDGDAIGKAVERLAVTAAEHIGLALANLNLRETLRHQSIRDPLTGLFNRRYMEVSLERELHLAARKQRPLGVIMIDLDYFKRFNDTHGHQIGDALLRALGQFLQKRMREEDIACRYGGEEFVLILPETPLDALQKRAEQLRETVKQVRALDSGESSEEITLSLGVAAFPEHGSTVQTLLQAADEALYRAKSEGRDRVGLAQL